MVLYLYNNLAYTKHMQNKVIMFPVSLYYKRVVLRYRYAILISYYILFITIYN